MGSGSIGRAYRGDFTRWRLKIGVHKYQSVPRNVFAAFQQAERESAVAVAWRAGKTQGLDTLPAWNLSYPAGAGKYHALFLKAGFDYQYEAFPVHLVCEQFSSVLLNTYKETTFSLGSSCGTRRVR